MERKKGFVWLIICVEELAKISNKEPLLEVVWVKVASLVIDSCDTSLKGGVKLNYTWSNSLVLSIEILVKVIGV